MESERIKLTRTVVDGLTLPDKGYSLTWDTELRNFGVRVTETGARAYVVQRRVGGKERRVTIAKCDVLSAEAARAAARKVLGQFASGVDPIADRARARSKAVTLKTAFADFLAARSSLKPTTVKDMERALRSLDWDKKRIAAITPDMVQKRHADLGKASHARANLTMRYLRAVLNFASDKYADDVGAPFLPFNPVRLTKLDSWFEVKRRRTFIKEHELQAWMTAVLGLANREAADYLQFLLMTGLRRTEGLDLRWRDVDMKGKTFTLLDTKNHDPHTLPLSDYLYELLEHRRKAASSAVASDEAKVYVFGGDRGRLSNLRYALAEIEKASGIVFTLHDLRRTFATTAERLDISAYALKRLMNHRNGGDVTEGYIGLDVERLRAPMQRVTDAILSAAGVRESAQVVAMLNRKKSG
jgi:integrase